MTHYDEYYHWQKARELYDPHKYDYLHAEGPNSGEFEGWKLREGCTCDACFLVGQVCYEMQGDFMWHWFEVDYRALKSIMEENPELDRIDAFIKLSSGG